MINFFIGRLFNIQIYKKRRIPHRFPAEIRRTFRSSAAGSTDDFDLHLPADVSRGDLYHMAFQLFIEHRLHAAAADLRSFDLPGGGS